MVQCMIVSQDEVSGMASTEASLRAQLSQATALLEDHAGLLQQVKGLREKMIATQREHAGEIGEMQVLQRTMKLQAQK